MTPLVWGDPKRGITGDMTHLPYTSDLRTNQLGRKSLDKNDDSNGDLHRSRHVWGGTSIHAHYGYYSSKKRPLSG